MKEVGIINLEDYDIPSAINQLRDILIKNIPHLMESQVTVDSLFGGDHQRFIRHIHDKISPKELDEMGLSI